MKKFLFILLAFAVSFGVNAKEYVWDETKDCSHKDVTIRCDLSGNLVTGTIKRYYSNGALSSELSYKNGKQEGVAKGYYENGNLMSEGIFKNGKMDGLIKTYYENGYLLGEANYKNGIAEFQKIYYPNGNLANEVMFKNGQAVHGYMYNIQGVKQKMTNAHLHNFMKDVGLSY